MLDIVRLRLAMYRGLGFEPIVDGNGSMHKMLIRAYHIYFTSLAGPNIARDMLLGAQSGDVHCLNFDDPKLSDSDYANLAWKFASS